MSLPLAIWAVDFTAAQAAITAEQTEFFEKKIRPVLSEQCYKCHGPEKQKGDVRLDSREAMLKSSDDGPIALPGKPEESTLIKSIRHLTDAKMPPKSDQLPPEQITALEEWVKMGMPWPESAAGEKPATAGAGEAAKAHWAWQPIKNPAPPAVTDAGKWAKGDLDHFILAKLEEKKITPSAAAPKRTLIRRASYDLTGLPPTAEETDAFEKDTAPDAFAKLVDRLLASPRYGERWGRYWLDVARYSDTRGYLAGGEERRYVFSYTYRDWVIDAMNRDLPYDQFIVQQIAGDQVASENDPAPMAAQGFLTLGRRFLNSTPDIIDDRIDVVSRGFMGLSVTCARCHDHKFDPISQKDYYALYGVFASSMEKPSGELPLLKTSQSPADAAEYQKQLAERNGEIEKFLQEKEDFFAWRMQFSVGAVAALPAIPQNPILDRAGHEALTQLKNKIDQLNATPIAPPRAHALFDLPKPIEPHVFIRGNPTRPGEQVPRRFLTILSHGDPKPFTQGSGRLELAQSIASKDNPLTARVMVNRVWNLHFGRGLVRTPGDFGTKGDLPTHPELLDWLATRFMAEGWSLKKLHRTIMLSATYQQASDDRPDAALADPENRLVWRMNRRRLDFEAMRDSLLACAGQLDLQMGGRGVEIAVPPFAKRRAVYGYVDRQNLPGIFRTFDFATPDQSSPQRFVTTVPQQALFMMNSPFVVERAQALAAQPKFHEANAYEEEVQELYRRVLGRNAEPAEVDAALRFVMNGITNPAAQTAEVPTWQCGWGGFDEAAKHMNFHKLTIFNGPTKTWQTAPKLPNADACAFVSLSAEGGHPGRDAAHSAIRRWTAPRDATVAVSGLLERPGDGGDGIIGRVISSRTGELLKVEVLPKQSAETKIAAIEVKAGDTLDFVVDPGTSDTSDGFRWNPVVGTADASWDARTQFAGPPPPRPKALQPWEQYAQVLLQTNEFAFID